MTSSQKQDRFRVVILGGGIHGVGVLHDLVSRGWKDVLLVEKAQLGAGTSSRSTKLIHGGLRYLEHVRDFPLVAEGLHERKLLIKLAPDLVKPLPLVFPVLNSGGVSRIMIKAGLTLYDLLAGRQSLGRHYSVDQVEAQKLLPPISTSLFKHFYVFFDGQTDDLGLVNRVALSASKLGGAILEETFAQKVTPDSDGYKIELSCAGEQRTISSRYIVNALGPWAHELYERSAITPKFDGVNNKGAHIIIGDLGLKTGVFLQSPEDGRIFFVLPWMGKTLVGTTETAFNDKADQLVTNQDDVDYLVNHCNRFFAKKITTNDVIAKFSGLRWLARDKGAGLSETSRSYQISQHRHGPGVIYTIYGGKLTAYRALSEIIGDFIVKDFGDLRQSETHKPAMWVDGGFYHKPPPIEARFQGM